MERSQCTEEQRKGRDREILVQIHPLRGEWGRL